MSASPMFSWQINLLDASLKPAPRRAFALPSLPLMPALLTGIAIAAGGYYLKSTVASLGDLRAQAQVAERKLSELERRVSAAADPAAQAQRQAAEALERELSENQALLASLQKTLAVDGPAWDATPVLTTLSDRHRDGIWLTRIRIDRLRREVTLEGRGADARSISAYVAALGSGDSPFSRMAVGSVTTEQNDAGESAQAAPAGDAARSGDAGAAQREAAAAAVNARALRFRLNAKGQRP